MTIGDVVFSFHDPQSIHLNAVLHRGLHKVSDSRSEPTGREMSKIVYSRARTYAMSLDPFGKVP